MRKKKPSLKFSFAIIPLVLMILTGIFENDINENYGNGIFAGLMVLFMIFFFISLLVPFFKAIPGVIGGKGYGMFWGNGKKAARIIKTGNRGIAIITSLSETKDGHLTINAQPVLFMELAIEDQNDEVFNTGFNVLIPRAKLPQFLPGKRFPVFIDPEDRKNIVLDETEIMELKNPKITAGDFTDEDRKVIEKMGKQALAKLIRLEDTGKSTHFQTVVKFSYEIHIAGEQTYEIEFETPLREKAALKIRSSAGKSFHARVHPFDNYKVMIDLHI